MLFSIEKSVHNITYAHSLNFNTIWEKGKKNETFDKAFGGNIRFFVLLFLVKDRISPSQYLFNDKLHVNISIYWKNWFNWNCRHSIFNFHILRRLSVRRFPFRSVHNSHWNTQIESHKMQYKFNQFFYHFSDLEPRNYEKSNVKAVQTNNPNKWIFPQAKKWSVYI